MEDINQKFTDMMHERMTRADNIMSNLGGVTPLEKSITQNEFDDKFAKGYSVFEKEGIGRYIDDLTKSVDSDTDEGQAELKKAEELIKGMTPVYIRDTEDQVKTFFVCESKEDSVED